MSLSALRATVSFLTLNSLLQIYENQPMEFWDSNQMISHPKLTPIFQSNQYLNLLAAFFTLTFIDTSNKLQLTNSIAVSTSVIIQNLNLFLPKTFNMISIYLQLIVLTYQLFRLFSSYYEKLQFDKIPQPHSSFQCQESIKELKIIKKQTQKKQISHKKKEKVQQKQIQSSQEPQIEKVEQSDNTEVESIENDFTEFMKQPSNDQTITEIETDNLYEVNHADLSQISQVKEDSKLTFQLKFNGEFTNLNCTFETFDSTLNILNSSYTSEQIKQIKIHLLLNLYDENEDCSCRLWCLKKLLSYN
ncbi:unnamed protein product (macronuclear) [Paramecium tetraurelia]|uniref:Transmembrane protein n=1 Tax=Paramecium tetraurelia TaxID=5888 RepID=A0BNT0_PARTE|nr:uncharacterized protein GSPATT00030836001 [Paramecium tetraurelia]CAK60197.1 unnamed protein product [Paramecium tetraurelia]|eukprot:XP_001427595.1 hypothetical protein (macronuclear) [Paramecium tetraurelia strain d4-2]